MIDATDKATATLPGIKPSPVTKPRGRKAVYDSPAAKQAAYRERKGVVAITVQLPAVVAADFDAWLAARGKGKSAVIEHLIRTQLLRKR